MLLAVLTELAVANEACATGGGRARARGVGAAVLPLVEAVGKSWPVLPFAVDLHNGRTHVAARLRSDTRN
jgi:hypothetical protein